FHCLWAPVSGCTTLASYQIQAANARLHRSSVNGTTTAQRGVTTLRTLAGSNYGRNLAAPCVWLHEIQMSNSTVSCWSQICHDIVIVWMLRSRSVTSETNRRGSRQA